MRTDVFVDMKEFIALSELVSPYIREQFFDRRGEHPLFPGLSRMRFFVDDLPDHIREIAPHFMDLRDMYGELDMFGTRIECDPEGYQLALDEWRERNFHRLRDPKRFTRQRAEDVVVTRHTSSELKKIAEEWWAAHPLNE